MVETVKIKSEINLIKAAWNREIGFVVSSVVSNDVVTYRGTLKYGNAKKNVTFFIAPNDDIYQKVVTISEKTYKKIFLNHEISLIDSYDSFLRYLSETHDEEIKRFSLNDLNADFFLAQCPYIKYADDSEDYLNFKWKYSLIPFVLKK